jgi:hypothetical protein
MHTMRVVKLNRLLVIHLFVVETPVRYMQNYLGENPPPLPPVERGAEEGALR